MSETMSASPKSLPDRSKAFLRGDLEHEYSEAEHKPTTSDLTMQDYADGWGINIEEAKRRFTHYRMSNPVAYPQTKNSNKASEITAAANEGMWSDFANTDDAKEQLSPNGPTPPTHPPIPPTGGPPGPRPRK